MEVRRRQKKKETVDHKNAEKPWDISTTEAFTERDAHTLNMHSHECTRSQTDRQLTTQIQNLHTQTNKLVSSLFTSHQTNGNTYPKWGMIGECECHHLSNRLSFVFSQEGTSGRTKKQERNRTKKKSKKTSSSFLFTPPFPLSHITPFYFIMFIRNILSVVVAIAACSSITPADASVASPSLTANNFESTIADGAT